jgi:CheY-like chemotaxis protein
MSPQVIKRAIEPFFTTKEVGRGTGLGLSMVYGFVKQSHGHMHIYSEVGLGTSVKLFLPRSEADAKERSRPSAEPAVAPQGRGERILVVEDDPSVRTAAVALLEGLNYRAIEAEDAASALAILRDGVGVDLLFSDLMMPNGMTGLDLLRAARERRPELKVLLTSGYPAQVIEQRGVLQLDAPLVSKPYRKRGLAIALRRALAEGPK